MDFDLLFDYSEWLDAQGHIAPGPETHEELVNEFLAQTNTNK